MHTLKLRIQLSKKIHVTMRDDFAAKNQTNLFKVVIPPLFLSTGGPRLTCSELLKHVMEVLQNSYSCSAYGEDYSSLLVKDILSVRKYWCDITPDQWHSQFAIFLNS